MSEPVSQFSEAALSVLDRMPFDPAATYFYEHLAGGFVWADEFPPVSSRDWKTVSHDDLYRYIINIRRCITLGDVEGRSIRLWRQVEDRAPNWPGLRIERRTGRIVKRLLAAERRARRCYDALLDDPELL